MIRYLIKNNFKLMFRNKWNLLVMILGPVLVIAVLSSAFSELMKSYEGVDEFTVGYRTEEKSPFANYVEFIKSIGEQNGITFSEYPEGTPKKMIENNNLAGFVEFNADEYVVYQSADYEVEGIILEYFLNEIINESGNTFLPSQIPTTEVNVQLPVKQLEYMPAIDSKDYYGIIYIVYFCWCGMICAAGMINSEKKYKLEQKFKVSNVSDFKLYLSRLIPIVLITTAGMGIATITTILLFDIHWGNVLLSVILIFLMILASTSFGLMLYYISGNMVITIIILFTSIWFMGFFGGSFETYMFSSFSDTVKNLSPIYHGNRALVELSCMGHSKYVSSCIAYTLIITIVCTAIAIIAVKIRKRGRV